MGRGRIKDSVQVDKYAVENVMLSNYTNAAEVSKKLGHADNYLAQVFSRGGYMRSCDYENLKGILRVTDSDIVKAVPIDRAEEVTSIYAPVPTKKPTNVFTLDADNQEFIDTLVKFGGGEKAVIINAIVKRFRDESPVALAIQSALAAVEALTI